MFFFLYEDIKCMVMISLNRTKMTTIEFIGFKTTIRWINEAKQKKEMKLRELEKEEMQMIMEVQTQRALIKAAIEEERDENCQESLEAWESDGHASTQRWSHRSEDSEREERGEQNMRENECSNDAPTNPGKLKNENNVRDKYLTKEQIDRFKLK